MMKVFLKDLSVDLNSNVEGIIKTDVLVVGLSRMPTSWPGLSRVVQSTSWAYIAIGIVEYFGLESNSTT